MRLLIVIFLGLQLFALQAFAHQRAIPMTQAKDNFKKNLLRRCHDGHGQACYDYGHMLLRSKTKRGKKVGKIYIRRACQLAYARACQRSTASILAKAEISTDLGGCYKPGMVEIAKFKVIAKGNAAGFKIRNVPSGSVWDQSGVKKNDLLLKINGEPLRTSSQLINGLKAGGFLADINRAGAPVPVAVFCP